MYFGRIKFTIALIIARIMTRIGIMSTTNSIITIAMTIGCCEKFIRVDPHRRVRDPVQLPLTCY